MKSYTRIALEFHLEYTRLFSIHILNFFKKKKTPRFNKALLLVNCVRLN